MVFTAYKRPLYWDRVLESWSQVRGIDDVSVTVFLEPSDFTDTMQAIVKYRFPHARVHVNPERVGVLENPYQALNTSFSAGNPFTVLAEDDVIVSSDVLEYFQWAQSLHWDTSLLGACAFSRAVLPRQDPELVNQFPDFCPLVWGTWSDRWFKYLEPTWDHDYTSGPVSGQQQGWDWNIKLRVMGERHFLFPSQSRSDHIGELGGQHMQPQDFSASRAPSFREYQEACAYQRPSYLL